MKPFPKLPNPHPDHAGRNFVERAANEAFARIAKRWQPSGEENETTHSTVSRYAQYLIDRLTGKAYSADELLSRPVAAADITDPENIVTNARVVSAIEGDAGAIRTAAETISRTEYEALMMALLDPVASAYQLATGIDLANASYLSAFMHGLDSIGVAASFVDGYALQSRFQKASGSTAYSLRQQANLAITGSPTRHRNGFLFTNDSATAPSSPQYLYGSFPAMNGEWTIVTLSLRDKEAPLPGQRKAVNAFKISPASLMVQMADTSNWRNYTSAGGTAAEISGLILPAEDSFMPIVMRNAGTSGAGSLTAKLLNRTAAASSTTGRGLVAFDKLAIGAGSSNGTTFGQYFDGMVPLVLIFNSVLTEQNLTDLNSLINRTIAPQVRWLIDGDSISSTASGWAWAIETASSWLGFNNDLIPLGVGGETTIDVIGRIGKQGADLTVGASSPAAGETVTIGNQTYTFRASVSTTANEVKIGATPEASILNLLNAINGGEGSGTNYGSNTVAHPVFSAVRKAANQIQIKGAAVGIAPTLETLAETSSVLSWSSRTATAATQTAIMGVADDLANTIHPVWYLLQAGTNDPGDTVNWQATHANLRTIWAAAKARGMKVVACTIPTTIYSAEGQPAEYWYGGTGQKTRPALAELNAAIRADSANYDVLLDVDDFLADTYGANYWQNTAVLSDGVHPSTATRRAVMNHLWTLVGTQMP